MHCDERLEPQRPSSADWLCIECCAFEQGTRNAPLVVYKTQTCILLAPQHRVWCFISRRAHTHTFLERVYNGLAAAAAGHTIWRRWLAVLCAAVERRTRRAGSDRAATTLGNVYSIILLSERTGR